MFSPFFPLYFSLLKSNTWIFFLAFILIFITHLSSLQNSCISVQESYSSDSPLFMLCFILVQYKKSFVTPLFLLCFYSVSRPNPLFSPVFALFLPCFINIPFTIVNMASATCQGLQSCLEPRLVEPLVLRHKLAPPKLTSPQSFSWPQRPSMQLEPEHQDITNHENDNNNKNKNKTDNIKNHDNNIGCADSDSKNNSNNGDSGGWSFLKALTNTSHNSKEATETETETEKVYVHPLVKRSSSMLSEKSLEMCTESLGSETGSDISESSDEFTCFSSESLKYNAIQRLKSRQFAKKAYRRASFPPPLSSISGSETVQVRPHREGGRLIITAVSVSSCSSYFRHERVDGRLRICLLSECEVEKEEEEEIVENDEGVVEEEHESEGDEEYYDDDDQNDDDAHGGGGGGGGGDGDDDYWGEGIEGENEVQRPSRCKEGMSSWGPLWVAIS